MAENRATFHKKAKAAGDRAELPAKSHYSPSQCPGWIPKLLWVGGSFSCPLPAVLPGSVAVVLWQFHAVRRGPVVCNTGARGLCLMNSASAPDLGDEIETLSCFCHGKRLLRTSGGRGCGPEDWRAEFGQPSL